MRDISQSCVEVVDATAEAPDDTAFSTENTRRPVGFSHSDGFWRSAPALANAARRYQCVRIRGFQ
ncbi:hypothetical protein [Paraburkholderia sp. HD33-4]|uniref:hypothetical protein n=1 Tax=Paraburkholderia sp. HD33-4 TaxID=2883242 RepID=UPI001F27E0BC|nr:hypothetical protein [Paraburkholderia sp. HD33-4]